MKQAKLIPIAKNKKKLWLSSIFVRKRIYSDQSFYVVDRITSCQSESNRANYPDI